MRASGVDGSHLSIFAVAAAVVKKKITLVLRQGNPTQHATETCPNTGLLPGTPHFKLQKLIKYSSHQNAAMEGGKYVQSLPA